MNREWLEDMEIQVPAAAATLPPAMVEETGWDILLALHWNGRRELDLPKLASMVSVPQSTLYEWLSGLERRQLITGTADKLTGEVRASLTPAAHDLLDRYLAATIHLQLGAHH